MAAQPSTQGWPKGLALVADYLTVDEETALVNALDELPWLGEIQRRTQQYGYHYSYRKQRVDDTPVPPLPACVHFLLDRFQDDHRVPLVAHQLIINEYQPGEQIKPHIDSTTDWGDCVVSLSLLDDWDMIFTHPGHETVAITLPRRSLLVLTSDARYEWKHGIRPQVEGRSRRISLTFREHKETTALPSASTS